MELHCADEAEETLEFERTKPTRISVLAGTCPQPDGELTPANRVSKEAQ